MSRNKKSALPPDFDQIAEEYSRSDARRDQAFERLGVKPDDVNKVPKISHILKKIKGGNEEAVELLRHSKADEAGEFFKVYEDLPVYLAKVLPIEAFCVAAGVDSRTICKLIFDQAMEQSNQAARMLVAANLEDLVQASINTGMEPLGIKDRENMQKAAFFLPMPEGMKINIQTSANATAAAQSSSTAVATLPPAEDTIRRLSNRFNNRFMGTETPALPKNIEPAVEFIPAVERETVSVEREEDEDED